MGDSSEGAVSVESLRLALDSLVEGDVRRKTSWVAEPRDLRISGGK